MTSVLAEIWCTSSSLDYLLHLNSCSLTSQFDPEKLKKLRPVFKEDGTITPGNSSTLSDGAAVLLLTSAAFAKEHDLKVLGRIRGFGDAAQVLRYHPLCVPHFLYSTVHSSLQLFYIEPFVGSCLSRTEFNGKNVHLHNVMYHDNSLVTKTIAWNIRSRSTSIGC